MYFYEVSDKTAACTIVTQNYISLRTNNFALNIKQVLIPANGKSI